MHATPSRSARPSRSTTYRPTSSGSRWKAVGLGLALTAIVAGTAAGCSRSTAAPPTTPGGTGAPGSTSAALAASVRRDIGVDPRSFVDDYESNAGESMTTSGGMPTGAAPSTTMTAGGGGGGRGGSSSGDASTMLPEPGPLDDNTFVAPGRNGEHTTAEDATSTFGLDVDTASFTVGRAWTDAGYRPDPASVRTEEWVNHVEYGYADPTSSLGAVVDAAPSPFRPGHHVVRVGVQAKRPSGTRQPANVVLVIDTSGSMDIRDRLGMVKASMAVLLQHLEDGDTIAIVTYASDSGVVLRPTPVEDTDTIIDAITDLAPGGSTNLESGLRTGYDVARKGFKPGAINRVILASDGVANQGIVDPKVLADFIQQQAGDGIQLVTAGYGMGNLNDHLMEQLADRGDGFATYIDRFEEAEEVFGRQINATIETAAIDAKAQITFDAAGVTSWRQLGYENRELTDDQFTDDTVDAGEVGAGHDVTVVYDVVLAPGVDAAQALGTVQLRWEDPASREVRTAEAALTAGQVAADWSSAPPSLRVAAAIAEAADALRTMATDPSGAPGRLQFAADTLDQAAAGAEAPLSADAATVGKVVRAAVGLPTAPPSQCVRGDGGRSICAGTTR